MASNKPRDWALSVSELNEYVRRSLESDPMLRALRLRGELSGVKRHSSGHIYFTLKDENARIQAVMFRQRAQELDFDLRDGLKVIAESTPPANGIQIAPSLEDLYQYHFKEASQ